MPEHESNTPLAHCVMIQGTASNVGKSLLVAALGRCLFRKGYRVAPFKSQNMSNHSYATADGGEVARAQAVQAVACGLEPSVGMSPIILKPQSEIGSQIVVRGQVDGFMTAMDYGTRRAHLAQVVREDLLALRQQYECVVLEGAGSPAEINLMQHEIVNMFVAREANAPVLLVGDIDRGGVFASLYGTLELLPPEDRARVRGILINKFRGDPKLLEGGLRQIEELTGVPVLGVLPMREDLYFPDEDSLALDMRTAPADWVCDDPIAVDVIRYPRVSNADDLGALDQDPRFDVQWVTQPRQLRANSWLILPGSKSTIADLQWLRAQGFESHIGSGRRVLGICGGYQMLGQLIADPLQIESQTKSINGLGLLPIKTAFADHKQVKQLRFFAPCAPDTPDTPDTQEAQTFSGYEIHCGSIEAQAECVPFLRAESRPESVGGYSSGTVSGTLIHGLFDARAMRDWFCTFVGRSDLASLAFEEQSLDQSLDAWADHFEQHVDMDAILKLLDM